MNEQIEILNLSSNRQIQALETFLMRFSLSLDSIDFAVVIKNQQQIIGSCCKFKNVIKCFAIDPLFQNTGLSQKLLTEVTYQIFQQGYTHTFVFTRLDKKDIFESLGYSTVIQAEQVVLLEKGHVTIQQTIANIDKQYDCSRYENGAIVVNCNPFTYGHQYLIETAAQQVEQLLVFVVQEDASTFPFSDRFILVKEGTKHITNVKVIPSTDYIISHATFPNYFIRDKEHSFHIYAMLDLSIFGHWYGQLNIKQRFVGEEPLDPMTSLYNETMKEVLPQFNMKLTIIERKSNALGIISASKVRELLKKDQWDEVAHYVPDCTFRYLRKSTHIIEKLKKNDSQH